MRTVPKRLVLPKRLGLPKRRVLPKALVSRAVACCGLPPLVLFAPVVRQPASSAVPELQHTSSAEVEQAPASQTGVLEVRIRLAGESRPVPTQVQNSTDPEACDLQHSLGDLLVSAENRGVQNVIATLVDVPTDRIPANAPQRLMIDNRDCVFHPHVSVARVGDTVVAKNSDPILHNTHYYGPLGSNIALPFEGMTVSRVFRRSGTVIVLCDVHGWMRAIIRVDDHPLHAVSDELGFLRISGIPTGSYTVELWHETLGARRVEVEIHQDETTRLDFEYEPSPSPLEPESTGGSQ